MLAAGDLYPCFEDDFLVVWSGAVRELKSDTVINYL